MGTGMPQKAQKLRVGYTDNTVDEKREGPVQQTRYLTSPCDSRGRGGPQGPLGSTSKFILDGRRRGRTRHSKKGK